MQYPSTITLFFLGLLSIGSGEAAVIDVEFKGTVDSVFADPDDPYGGALVSSVGTQFIGHYRYDPATLPVPDPAPTTGIASYTMSGLPYGINVNIGGVQFGVDGSLNIGIANNIGGGVDQYTVFAESGTAGGLNDYLSLSLLLQDSSGNVLNDTALQPLTNANIGAFEVKGFFLDGVQTIGGVTYQYQVQGSLTSIPEPDTFVLVAFGAIVFVASEYRRKTM